MTVQENMLALYDTLGIFECYDSLPFDESYETHMSKLKECQVLLPEDINKLKKTPTPHAVLNSEHCNITCEDTDSFTMAYEIYNRYNDAKIMVLNFANPYNPGGGVWRGANAQEEDLCRRSNLLFSLESDGAKKYYQYNKEHKNRDSYANDYGTNSMILTPNVTIIKDKAYKLHFEFASVSVLTMAAPIIQNKQYLSDEYIDIFFERITSVLLCAAHYGYTHLILGAWGCGAFGNDSETVAGLFHDAIENFSYDGKNVHQLFESITFAVPYSEEKPANYETFAKRFNK